MKRVPLYVLTGFLGTGKTMVLQKLLLYHYDKRPGVIQFELGQTGYSKPYPVCFISPYEPLEAMAAQIKLFLEEHSVDELWVEWNGMVPISKLESLCHHKDIGFALYIRQIVFITTEIFTKTMLHQLGQPILSQLVAADMAVVVVPHEGTKGQSKTIVQRVTPYLREVNATIGVVSSNDISHTYQKILEHREHNLLKALVSVVLLLIVLIQSVNYIDSSILVYVSLIVTRGTGTFFQAMPFLLLGALTSAALQYLVPPNWWSRYLTKGTVIPWGTALLGGVLSPVCDCGTVPVFRSLLLQGVSVPVAIFFMLVTPLVNPIAVIVTYYAFPTEPIISIGRLVLGIGIAFAVSMSCWRLPVAAILKSSGTAMRGQNISVMPVSSVKKGITFLYHAKTEFLQMIPYLMMAAFLSAVFQTMGSYYEWATMPPMVAIGFMMSLAFVLSVCSTADAMIARNFISTLSVGPIMAFLLVGPMIDLKNVLLLRAICQKNFIFRLLITIIVVVFFIVLILF